MQYLKYAEAVKLFMEVGLSETTFRRKVKEYPIRHQLPGGRSRGADYLKEDVEKALEQARKEKPQEYQKTETQSETQEQSTSKGATDWAKASDLPYMLAYDYEMYGVENTVDISITHKWWAKNPYMARLLFDANDRRSIWGGITIMPMEEETIFRLLKDEMTERDITPDHIKVYEPGKKYYGYIASATVRPEHATHFRELLQSMLDFWCEQYPDIQIKKLYAYAASDKGWDLIKRLFFAPRYDLGRNAFELNPYERNPSKLLRAFQECLRAKGATIETPI